MRRFLGYAIVALVLFVAGVALARAADAQRRFVSAQEQVAILALDAAETEFGAVERSMALTARLPVIGTAILADVRQQRATAAYWRAEYSALPSSEAELSSDSIDPDLLLLSANAAFRTAEAQPTTQATLKDLDHVLRTYLLLLKKRPGHVDGVYNYEYVVRLRNTLARPPLTAPMRAGATDQTPDRPSASTIHGEEGSPPARTQPNDFKVIVPLQQDERGEQMRKAGSGTTKARKG